MILNLIPIAASIVFVLDLDDVPVFHQIIDDGVRTSLGDLKAVSQIAQTDFWIFRDTEQDAAVAAEECPFRHG
jgi:hypothetical protein